MQPTEPPRAARRKALRAYANEHGLKFKDVWLKYLTEAGK